MKIHRDDKSYEATTQSLSLSRFGSIPVVAGVKDLIVCMKETGIYRKLTFPRTMLRQNTADMGKMRLHRSTGLTSMSGLIFNTLIAMWAPTVEQMKCTVDTVSGNLKSSFCHTHTAIQQVFNK